jgi:hypothetical protein
MKVLQRFLHFLIVVVLKAEQADLNVAAMFT